MYSAGLTWFLVSRHEGYKRSIDLIEKLQKKGVFGCEGIGIRAADSSRHCQLRCWQPSNDDMMVFVVHQRCRFLVMRPGIIAGCHFRFTAALPVVAHRVVQLHEAYHAQCCIQPESAFVFPFFTYVALC